MLTKGAMIKALKVKGVRVNEMDKKLEKCKTFEVTNLYFEKCVEKGDSNG